MEIVIDIPENAYRQIRNWGVPTDELRRKIYDIIDNGTPLPKGHGRIMDVDKVIKKMEERLKDYRSIWETAGVETALDMFGETIIEADKEGE